MISKGTAHNNGARLAHYLITSQHGQQAELWQLRGFAADNIKDAFRDVQIMAAGTRAEQPFFHVQVRLPDFEDLTRTQYERIADRIEAKLGLSGQPRAIAFHTYEDSGHAHMHIAWSRIDQETMTAKPLPYFKFRLKEVSRELEIKFDLTRVRNEVEGPIRYAPTRAEDEQARRLGVDIREIRRNIRDCYDRSDCGRSFEAALAHQGLILAKGERRDFLVIDEAGGMHALGKRILGVSAAVTRDRLSDLDREHLPSIEQARSFIAERAFDRQLPKHEPMPDRDREEIRWQDALAKSAIEKEKIEQNFVEPKPQKERPDSREKKRGEKKWPILPPVTEKKHWTLFEKAATDATRDNRIENLKGEGARVWAAFRQSDSAKAFAAALDEKGIAFARVTQEEAYRSEREAEFAKAIGNKAPRFKEGEIVILTEPRPEYRRAGQIIVPHRIHKLDQSLAGKFVERLANKVELQGIDATRKASDERAQQRSEDWRAIRLENATRYKGSRGNRDSRNGMVPQGNQLERSGFRVVGKMLDVVASALESFSPVLTPEQKRDGQNAVNKREAAAEHRIDVSSHTAEMAQQRREDEQEREAARQRERQRERGGRDR